MDKGLFYTIMEAEGDLLQPFDEGNDSSPTEEPTSVDDSNTNEAMDDQPPEMNGSDNIDDMSMDSDDSGGNMNDDSTDEEADEKDTKLSDKANNILNQQLYQKMINRNSEIEEILNNIKKLVPLLPYDVVKSNDESVNNLKTALLKGQKYVINDFVDSGYGVNLLFYQKLDSLYVLLLNQIDSNLKKIKKNNM